MTMTVEALHPRLRALVPEYHRRGFPNFKISSYVGATEAVVEAVLSGAMAAYTKPLSEDPSDSLVVRACEKLATAELASHGPQVGESQADDLVVKACERLAGSTRPAEA